MTILRLSRTLMLAAAAASLIACSTVKKVTEGSDVDYRSARTTAPLEVPPDLTTVPADQSLTVPGAGGAASYQAYARGQEGVVQKGPAGTAVLPEQANVRMERAGTQRWLVVSGDPNQLWSRIREFWLQNGLLIAREDPQTGVMETDWAEQRPNVTGGVIQSWLAKHLGSLYSTGTRDKFRVRLEPGSQPGTTEIYLSHQGLVERVSEINSTGPVTTMWEPRPNDPELEAEMLRKLMVHLGVEERVAQTVVASGGAQPAAERATLRSADGYKVLDLQDDFERAWRRVGLSLDRVGFTVEDRNREQGIYFVRYADADAGTQKKGFLSGLFSRKKATAAQQYQVKVEAVGGGSQVSVHDAKGAVEKSGTGDRILGLLYEQLR
jgi:outer membrane protein assembly factor BamC